MVFYLLAHHEAVDGAGAPAARAHGGDDRHRAELEAADRIDVALAREQIAHDFGDEMRPLGVEHRRLHVEVVVAHRAGHELELAEEERFRLDDLEEPRLRLRERGFPLSQHTRCAPLPLVGRGWGWGSFFEATLGLHCTTPTPPAFAALRRTTLPTRGRVKTEFLSRVDGR